MNFPMTRLLQTYLAIGAAKNGGQEASPPIEMPPLTNIITTKTYVFSVSFSIFAYNNIRVQQTNINFHNQVAWVPSNQILAIQCKCITREKFKVFVLKVATSGPHLLIL